MYYRWIEDNLSEETVSNLIFFLIGVIFELFLYYLNFYHKIS